MQSGQVGCVPPLARTRCTCPVLPAGRLSGGMHGRRTRACSAPTHGSAAASCMAGPPMGVAQCPAGLSMTRGSRCAARLLHLLLHMHAAARLAPCRPHRTWCVHGGRMQGALFGRAPQGHAAQPHLSPPRRAAAPGGHAELAGKAGQAASSLVRSLPFGADRARHEHPHAPSPLGCGSGGPGAAMPVRA